MYDGEVTTEIGDGGFPFNTYSAGSSFNMCNMIMDQEPIFTIRAVTRVTVFTINVTDFNSVMYQCEDL